MEKKVQLFLLTFVFFSVFFISGVYAQNHTDETYSFEFEEDVELELDGGITPDSAFYFVDEFFDRFGDKVEIREEKIAEIKAMVQEGKIEDAKKALERYKEHADEFEREVSPDEREEAKRSASAIYNTIKEIENEIPEEDRSEFFDEVVERERGIITASEIAGKIKELCESLSEIDPLEYSRVCATDDDAPEWQKNLDRDLTDKQRQEAQKFGRIMSQCFETSGQECACEEIPFTDFAEVCSMAAPLATACEIENDENACEQLDDIEMPELPGHLQDVMDELERDVMESQFELHMPRECREAGATNPRDCMRIMVQTHAPEECRDALLDANVQNEREAREICENIMFEQNAPAECIEAGITDPRECSRHSFEINAPQECIDAGLTGEHRSDHKKCEEIMNSLDRSGPNRGPGEGFGFNCRAIENPEDRLRCYDGASQGAREQQEGFEERFRENHEAQRQCAERCLGQGGAWDFSNGNCECHFPENNFDDRNFEDEFDEGFEENFDDFSPEDICAEEGGTWDGSNCVFEDDSFTDGSEEESFEEDTTTEEPTDDGSTEESRTTEDTTESTTEEETSSDSDEITGGSIVEFDNEEDIGTSSRESGEYKWCPVIEVVLIDAECPY